MADLNPNHFSSPLLESDDISVLVHNLLHSSTLPSSLPLHASHFSDHHQCLPASEIPHQFCGSAPFSDSSSTINFSSRRSAFSGGTLSSAEAIDELDGQSEDKDASDLPRKSGPLRRSSKRTRAAEIHNFSEKRRRQRINEKMKALQKLIPNSNKTDRASMLDDAIEYLKQLQLQVQMLAMRNGSALNPLYIPGVMHSAQPTNSGVCFNEVDGLPSSSGRTSFQSSDQKTSRQNVYHPAGSSNFASSDQKILMPVELKNDNSDCPFTMEPSTSNHC